MQIITWSGSLHIPTFTKNARSPANASLIMSLWKAQNIHFCFTTPCNFCWHIFCGMSHKSRKRYTLSYATKDGKHLHLKRSHILIHVVNILLDNQVCHEQRVQLGNFCGNGIWHYANISPDWNLGLLVLMGTANPAWDRSSHLFLTLTSTQIVWASHIASSLSDYYM